MIRGNDDSAIESMAESADPIIVLQGNVRNDYLNTNDRTDDQNFFSFV